MRKPKGLRIVLVKDSSDNLGLTLRAFKKHNLRSAITVARYGEEELDEDRSIKSFDS